MLTWAIQPVLTDEKVLKTIQALQTLELEATDLFGTFPGYEFCVRRSHRDEEEHRRVLRDGVTLVAVQPNIEIPLGFAMVLPLSKPSTASPEGCGMHLLELNTSPAVQRQGVGKGLLASAENWARENGATYMTLFTFRDVPWNAPYYAKQGYQVFTPDFPQQSVLKELWDEEIEIGWHQAPRVAMKKFLE